MVKLYEKRLIPATGNYFPMREDFDRASLLNTMVFNDLQIGISLVSV
jgi:hypothetical protein